MQHMRLSFTMAFVVFSVLLLVVVLTVQDRQNLFAFLSPDTIVFLLVATYLLIRALLKFPLKPRIGSFAGFSCICGGTLGTLLGIMLTAQTANEMGEGFAKRGSYLAILISTTSLCIVGAIIGVAVYVAFAFITKKPSGQSDSP